MLVRGNKLIAELPLLTRKDGGSIEASSFAAEEVTVVTIYKYCDECVSVIRRIGCKAMLFNRKLALFTCIHVLVLYSEDWK